MLLSPRGWWHDCNDHHEKHTTHETSIDQKDCFACDLDLDVALTSKYSFYKITRGNSFKINENSSHTVLPADRSVPVLRGPPTC